MTQFAFHKEEKEPETEREAKLRRLLSIARQSQQQNPAYKPSAPTKRP